jgi:hypothetical protein
LDGLSASSCEILLSRHARRNERNGTAQGKNIFKTVQFAIRILLLPHFLLCGQIAQNDRDSSGSILLYAVNDVPAVPEMSESADNLCSCQALVLMPRPSNSKMFFSITIKARL